MLSLEIRRNGEPDSNLRRAAGSDAPAAGSEEAPAKGWSQREGQPKQRPTVRAVGEPSKSDDAGERQATGPGRAKGARVETNLRRAT